jgi:hypothetical protein
MRIEVYVLLFSSDVKINEKECKELCNISYEYIPVSTDDRYFVLIANEYLDILLLLSSNKHSLINK